MAKSPDRSCRTCGNPAVPGQSECPHCGSPYNDTSSNPLGTPQGSTKLTQPLWGNTSPLQNPGMTPPVQQTPVLPSMLDQMSLPGKWGRQITIGVFIMMTGDFAIHAIGSFLDGNLAEGAWWLFATLSGWFLLTEKFVAGR